MPEILTESFCERCGTRYTFQPTAPKTGRIGRLKTIGKGLRNYVLSDETTLEEAFADARSDDERELSSQQLDAFHQAFNFCMSCRQYTCATCWNGAEGKCLSCAPHLGREILEAPFATPASQGSGMIEGMAAAAGGNGSVAPGLPGIEASAWPAIDLASPSDAASLESPEAQAPDTGEDAASRLEQLFGSRATEVVEAGPAQAEPLEAAGAEAAEAAAAGTVETQAAPPLPFEATAAPEEHAPTELEGVPATAAAAPEPSAAAEEAMLVAAAAEPAPFVGPAAEATPEAPVDAASIAPEEPLPTAETATEGDLEAVPHEPVQQAARQTRNLLARFRPHGERPTVPQVDQADAAAAQVAPSRPTEAAAEPEPSLSAATPAEPPVAEPAAPAEPAAASSATSAEPTSPEPTPAQGMPSGWQYVAPEATDTIKAPAAPSAAPAPSGPAPAPLEPGLPPAWPARQPSPRPAAPAPSGPPGAAAPWQMPQPPAGWQVPAAHPEWPPSPQWPSVQASASWPQVSGGQPAPVQREALAEGVWEQSSRDVLNRPGSGVQACVSCGLPLSATARFCRRCGSPQG